MPTFRTIATSVSRKCDPCEMLIRLNGSTSYTRVRWATLSHRLFHYYTGYVRRPCVFKNAARTLRIVTVGDRKSRSRAHRTRRTLTFKTRNHRVILTTILQVSSLHNLTNTFLEARKNRQHVPLEQRAAAGYTKHTYFTLSSRASHKNAPLVFEQFALVEAREVVNTELSSLRLQIVHLHLQ